MLLLIADNSHQVVICDVSDMVYNCYALQTDHLGHLLRTIAAMDATAQPAEELTRGNKTDRPARQCCLNSALMNAIQNVAAKQNQIRCRDGFVALGSIRRGLRVEDLNRALHL